MSKKTNDHQGLNGTATISGTAEEIIGKVKKALKKVKKKKPAKQVKEKKEFEIVGASLSGGFCNYSYDHTVAPNTTNSLKVKSGVLVHKDLVATFGKLPIHLAVICEEIDPVTIKDIDMIPPFKPGEEEFDALPEATRNVSEKSSFFTISAFEIEGDGEKEGVKLFGSKRLSNGELIGLDTYKVTWANSSYSFIDDLRVAIDDLKLEVDEYRKGKCAPQLVQQGFDFPSDNGEDEPGEDETID